VSATETHYKSGDYWQTRLKSTSDFKVALALRALAAAQINITPGLRAVEIGCGNGAFLFPLSRALDAHIRSFALYGFDISSLAVDHARNLAEETGETRVFFQTGSATDVREQFDIAFLMDVVEHVSDPYAFLASVRNIAPLALMTMLGHALTPRRP
jgi:2-polyprenyl-3-methyl-5-hydroxy-6-metoxy-1,4-benzoquinol methylase